VFGTWFVAWSLLFLRQHFHFEQLQLQPPQQPVQQHQLLQLHLLLRIGGAAN